MGFTTRNNKPMPGDMVFRIIFRISPPPAAGPITKYTNAPKTLWGIGKRVFLIAVILGDILFILNAGINFAKSMGLLATKLPPVSTSSKIRNLDISTSLQIADATNVFVKGQNVYLRFDITNVQAGTSFETKWYYSVGIFGKNLYISFTTLLYTSKINDSNMYFFLNKPETAGNYLVDLYMDGHLVGRRFFPSNNLLSKGQSKRLNFIAESL